MKSSKILISFLLVLLVAISVSAVAAEDATNNATIIVDGNDDVAIQAAIDNATAGTTIDLGSDKEYNINATVNVNKQVTLTGINVTLNGEGQTKSGNDGSLYNGFINIDKDGSGATITGLSLVNVNANKEYTHANTLKGYGIQIANGATGVLIDDCDFIDFNNGVYISSAPENIIRNCWFTGVSTLINNIPGGPKDRGSYGISIMRSKGNIIEYNTFYGPLCDGVSIASGSSNTIVRYNTFTGNAYGIYFGGASTGGSLIEDNDFINVGSFSASYYDKDLNQTVWDNFTDLPVISVQKSSDNFEIKDNTFYANTNNVLIGANEANTAHGYPSDIGNIKVHDNLVIQSSPDTVMETVVLFNIISETGILTPVGPIAVYNNTLNGAKSAAYWSYDWGKDIYGDIYIDAADPVVTYFEINSAGTDKVVATLRDVNGKALAGEEVVVVNGRGEDVYTTDENGVLTIEGPEDIVILTFEGSTKLAPATTNVTINEAELVPTTVSVNSINKYATSSGKYELVATLKDVSGNPIYNKTVCIIDTTHDGQAIVIGVTGFDGVVKGSISASIVANYPICAFFPGDEMYASAIDFANVNVKINPTTLTTPTKTYKVKATKKLSVTLKSSGKAVKGKKITVKVNGKTYTAKTNAKGVATVTVKIAKKGTFKYTAKFAGDKLYKAVSKTGTIKVKA